VETILSLPQPASEWSRLAEEELKGKIGKDWRKDLEAIALSQDLPSRHRLRALRILSEDFMALSNEFVSTLSQDTNPEVRGQAVWLLGLRGGAEARVRIPLRLRDPDPFVRRRAAEAATRIPNLPVAPLTSAMGDSERLVRYAAMTALAHQPTATWFDQAAAHPKPQVRMRALVAAKLRHELPPSTNIYALVKRLAEARTLNREDHLDLLRVFGIFREQMQKSTTVQRFLVEQYPAEDPDVAFEQAYLIGYYGYPVTNGFPKLLHSLQTEPNPVRQFHIAQAIAKLPSGWTETEEQQLVNWFVKQQTGWFAEFKDKGVEFPEFWSACDLRLRATSHPCPLQRQIEDSTHQSPWRRLSRPARVTAKRPRFTH
jgi:hypothetical protein